MHNDSAGVLSIYPMPINTYNLSQAFTGLGVRVTSAPTNPYNTDKSVADTIAQMARIARASKRSPIVVAAVQDAVKGLTRTADDESICRAIFHWIKGHISFVQDEAINAYAFGMNEFQANDTELLITPETLLSMPIPMGDCDDFSTLTASMLLTLDFKVAFVTIAADSEMPEMLSHVYVKVWLDDENRGMYLDCSHGPYPGWETSKYTRKLEWGI